MTRSQFLRWLGFLLAVYIISAWLDLRFMAPILGYLPFEEVEERYITWAVFALFAIPYFASNVRRLHDVSRTGFWMLLAILPILVLYFSSEVGFFVYEKASDPDSMLGASPNISAFVTDWLSWLIIALAIISFFPVIFWSLKKGSNDPNKYGTRQ